MRPKPALLTVLAALTLVTTGLSLPQVPAVPAPAQTVQLKVENSDVREVLRGLFKQVKIPYTIAPEIQGAVSADFRGLVLEDALSVVTRQVGATVMVEAGVYQIVPRDRLPRVLVLDGPVEGERRAIQPESQATFLGSDEKFLYFQRDNSVLKIDKATMKIVSTLELGPRRIRFIH